MCAESSYSILVGIVGNAKRLCQLDDVGRVGLLGWVWAKHACGEAGEGTPRLIESGECCGHGELDRHVNGDCHKFEDQRKELVFGGVRYRPST